MISAGVIGIERRLYHGAAFDLAGHRERREYEQRHGQDHANQPRHDIELRGRRRVVPGVRAHLERRLAAVGQSVIVRQRRLDDWTDGAERGT
jgi:hypothetical protein